MLVGVDFEDILHRYGMAAKPVETGQKTAFVGYDVIGVEVGIHHAGVDTGVGAAGADHLHGPAADCGEGLFERLLHARIARLPLPSVEGGSVVREFQKSPHQSRSRYVLP